MINKTVQHLLFICAILTLSCASEDLGPPPESEFTASTRQGVAPLTVTFTLAILEETDYTVKRYEWDFDGDGIAEETTDTNTVSHVYTDPGEYSPRGKIIYNEANAMSQRSLSTEQVDDGTGNMVWSNSIIVN